MNQFMAHSTRWVETQFETLKFSIDFPPKLRNRILIDCNMTILNWFPANTYETMNKFQNLIERVQNVILLGVQRRRDESISSSTYKALSKQWLDCHAKFEN